LVDPVLESGALADEVEAAAGAFSLGPNSGVGQPQGWDQVPARQLGQHPGVDAVGLTGQRSQTLDLLSVGDVDLPAEQLQLIVDEAGSVRLDGGSRRLPYQPATQRTKLCRPSRSGPTAT
jgi:hypothetical protein